MKIKVGMLMTETTPTGLLRSYTVHSVSECAVHLVPTIDDGEHNPQTWDIGALRTAIRSGAVIASDCE